MTFGFVNNIPNIYIGLSFIMKENIFPVYEDPENINGGAWSFRILRKDLTQVWNDIVLSLLGNTLFDDMDNINGISLNPKNCVIKIWTKNIPEDVNKCDIVNINNVDKTKVLFMISKEKSENSDFQKSKNN